MNNGIHYYGQLKSNTTQGIPLLWNSLEIVKSNAVPLQVISYLIPKPSTKGYFLPASKGLIDIENIGRPFAYSHNLVSAHFSSVMQKKKVLIYVQAVKIDLISICEYK